MKSISEMWPKFLIWIDEYVGCGINGSAKAQYSREDMRYAYQAGYELSQWISIDDKLPDIGQECLIRIPVSNYHNIESARHKSNGVWSGAWCDSRGSGCTYKVSHWMPIPEEPK